MKAVLTYFLILILVSGCLKDHSRALTANAVEQGDASLCEDITDPVLAKQCVNEVIAANDDISRCLDLPSSRDFNECIKAWAVKKQDVSYCQVIDDEKLMNLCIREVINPKRI